MHEAKAMVGASTNFSQCVHACMNQSVCRSCYIILLVFFLEWNVISIPFGVRVATLLPYDDMTKLNNHNSSLCLCWSQRQPNCLFVLWCYVSICPSFTSRNKGSRLYHDHCFSARRQLLIAELKWERGDRLMFSAELARLTKLLYRWITLVVLKKRWIALEFRSSFAGRTLF